MDQRAIKIACRGADVLPMDLLIPLQGSLKKMSDANRAKLKREIIELGFTAPIHVWAHPVMSNPTDDVPDYYILDGHQRLDALESLKADGYAIPLIPVDYVEAATVEEAKRKLLGMASQFGVVDSEGLHEFAVDAGIDWQEIARQANMPDIDMAAFCREYYEVSDADLQACGLIDTTPMPLVSHDQEPSYDFVVRCDTPEQLQRLREFFNATKATVSYQAAARFLWD